MIVGYEPIKLIEAMKKVLSILLISACATSVYAQKDEAALAILDAMSDKYQAMPAFTSDFQYILENPSEDLSETFEGTVSVKGDMYRLSMEGQEIINNGETVWTYMAELNEVNISEYMAEEQDISLNNIFTLYKEGYKYLYIESADNGQLDIIDLVPEDVSNNYFKIRLAIKTDNQELNRFQVFDKNGNRYIYKIVTFKEEAALGDDYFNFDPSKYEGVEVIDFR
jgi:outer membrane lipoprotein carrier protein